VRARIFMTAMQRVPRPAAQTSSTTRSHERVVILNVRYAIPMFAMTNWRL